MQTQDVPFPEVADAPKDGGADGVPFPEVVGKPKKKPSLLDFLPAGGLKSEIRIAQVASEQTLGMTKGHAGVTSRLVHGDPAYEARGAGGQLKEIFNRLFPGLPGGKEPSLRDFETLAARDPNFAAWWNPVREDQRNARNAELFAHGDKPDWKAIREKYADEVVAETRAFGEFSEDVAPKMGSPRISGDFFHEAPVLAPGKKGTRALALEAADRGTAGITRPAPTDEDVRQAAIARLYQDASGEIDEDLPWPIQSIVRGAAEGAKIAAVISPAGGAARAAGAVGKAVAPLVEGAALSAVSQGLGIASGSREEFSFGELAKEAAIMGLGAKVGDLAAIRFPKRAGAARTTGMLGTMEVANHGLAALQADPGAPKSATPWRDRAEYGLQTIAMLGTAHAAGAVGRPSPELAGKIAESRASRAAEQAQNAAASDLAGQGAGDTLRRWLNMAHRNAAGQEIDAQVMDATLQTGIDLGRSADDFGRWLKGASGGNTARAKEIEKAIQLELDRNGAVPENAHPMPEHGLAPEVFAEGVARMKEVGAAGLQVGRMIAALDKDGLSIAEARYSRPDPENPSGPPQMVTVTRKEFDQGHLNDEVQTPVDRLSALDGVIGGVDGWSLVGGIKFHEGRGFWLPQVGVGTEAPSEMDLSAFRRASPVQAPISETTASHLLRRQRSLDEALNDPARMLDLSHQSALDVMRAELETVRRAMKLDGYRERGMLLYDAERPNAAARKQMAEETSAIEKEIAGLERQFREKPTEELHAAIQAKKFALEDLKAASKDELYRELPRGKEWGPWAGMWLHRSAYDEVKASMQRPTGFAKVYKALHNAAKAAKIAFSPAQLAMNAVGNTAAYGRAGVDLGAHPEIVERALAEQAGGKKSDLGLEFETLTRHHNLGGSGDVSQQDISRLGKTVQKAAVIGKGITFIDRGWARAAYFILREQGYGGRGPMSPSDAIRHVARVMDYGTLPGWVSGAANYFSFIRWPAKTVQSLGVVMQQRPRLFGEPVDTPFDQTIREGAGGGKAQAALVARGIANLALSASKVMVPLYALQQVQREEIGLSQAKLDAFLENDPSFKELPDWLRWAVKKTFIPTGFTKLGRLEGWNPLSMDPHFAALSYFTAAVNGRDWKDIAWQYGAKKSLFGGTAAQVVARKNYSGNNVGEGFGPGERMWPLESLFMPAIPQQQIDTYFNEQNVPPEERDALRQVMRTLGVPVKVIKPPPQFDAAAKILEGLRAEGVIRMVEPDTGGSFPEVSPDWRNTPKGEMAQQLMDAMSKVPASYYAAQLKMWRDQERLKQQMNNAGN